MGEYQPREVINECGRCTDHCATCVSGSLEASPEGRLLSAMEPRYGYFHWEDKDRFRKFLGEDMDALKHGEYQAFNVALPFIEHQNLSDKKRFTADEAKLLILGNILHDAHEAHVGDIALPDKTEDIYEAELALNLSTVQNILGLSEDDQFLQRYRSVVGDLKGWSFAGRAFNAIEWCGYFMSGIKAWSLRNHELLDDDERRKCYEMGYACVTKDTPVLRSYAEEFEYPNFIMRANSKAIEECGL